MSDRPHLDATFILNHIISSIPLVLAFGGMIWWQSSFQATTEQRLAAGEETRKIYVPVVDELRATQGVTNDRLLNLGTALIELRNVGRDQIEESAKLRERLAAVETVLKASPPRPNP